MHRSKTGETLFFAEGVLGERTIGGCKEYRIKWKRVFKEKSHLGTLYMKVKDGCPKSCDYCAGGS